MTHGSLFAGIGGFDLGFERAGIKTVWQVEIDPFCRKVLERHWPDVKRFEDVRGCGRHNLASVDIITGGFPCQPFSAAGRKAGKADNRYLWPEMLRVISVVRPAFIVAENVAGLIAMHDGKILDEIYASLEAEDYEVLPPIIVPACAVGARHRRDRVWIVAHALDGRPQERRPESASGLAHGEGERKAAGNERSAITEPGALSPNSSSGRTKRLSAEGPVFMAYPNGRGKDDGNSPGEGLPDWAGGTVGQPSPLTEFERPSGREIERDFRGMAHGVSRRVDRLRSLGNAVVPQIAQWIGERIMQVEEARARIR